MATEAYRFLAFSLALLLSGVFNPLGSQENPGWEYRLCYDETGNPVFDQVLSWEVQPLVLRYEVEVRKEGEERILVLLDTSSAEVYLNLAPGAYQYRILSYNLLDRLELEGDWLPLVVHRARQPRVYSLTPHTLYLEDLTTRLEVVGEDLDPAIRVDLEGGGRILFSGSGEVNLTETSMVLNLPEEVIEVGVYTVRVVNPGGLSHVADQSLSVRYRKPVDFFLSLCWSPRMILYDSWYADTWSEPFSPLGVSIRGGSYFIKERKYYLGLEIPAEFHFSRGGTSAAAINSRYYSLGLRALAAWLITRPLKGVLALGAHGEISSHQFDYQGTPGHTLLESIDLSISSALSLQFYLRKNLYLEAGLEWRHLFHRDTTGGFLNPLVGVGWYY